MKIFIWCSDCAEFHEVKREENPYGGDAEVYSDQYGHCLVVVHQKEEEG